MVNTKNGGVGFVKAVIAFWIGFTSLTLFLPSMWLYIVIQYHIVRGPCHRFSKERNLGDIYLVAILFEVKTYCTLCKDASIFLKKGKRINSHGIGFYVNIWNIILLVWYIYTVQYLTFIIILIPTSKIKQRS